MNGLNKGRRDNNPITFHLYAKTKSSSKASESEDSGPRAFFIRRVRTTDALAVRQSSKSSKGQGLWHLCGGRSVTAIPIGTNEAGTGHTNVIPPQRTTTTRDERSAEEERKEGGKEEREEEPRRKNNSSAQFTSAKVTGTRRGREAEMRRSIKSSPRRCAGLFRERGVLSGGQSSPSPARSPALYGHGAKADGRGGRRPRGGPTLHAAPEGRRRG